MLNRSLIVAVVAAGALAACQQDTRNDTRNLERKLDDLNKKVDQLIARPAGGGPGAAAARPPRLEPDRAKTYSMPVDGDAVDGPADAKVTLVKAYDYACPYCERVRGTMDELRKKYGNDLRVVYKQLVVHPSTAMSPALAFCASAKQGKFRQMDDLLWDKGFKGRAFFAKEVTENQKCWESAEGCPLLNGYAQELGLNMTQFKSDMKDCMALVQKDMKDLQSLNVSATPAFFINGRYAVGAMGADSFSTIIDEELKKATERIAAGVPQASYYQQVVVEKGLKQIEKPAQ